VSQNRAALQRNTERPLFERPFSFSLAIAYDCNPNCYVRGRDRRYPLNVVPHAATPPMLGVQHAPVVGGATG
jgi:hypothetical protein